MIPLLLFLMVGIPVLVVVAVVLVRLSRRAAYGLPRDRGGL